MFSLKQQKGFALIAVMIVVCIIALLYFYTRSRYEEKSSPVKTIETYNNAKDDLDDIRKRLDKQNIAIEKEIISTSTIK